MARGWEATHSILLSPSRHCHPALTQPLLSSFLHFTSSSFHSLSISAQPPTLTPSGVISQLIAQLHLPLHILYPHLLIWLKPSLIKGMVHRPRLSSSLTAFLICYCIFFFWLSSVFFPPQTFQHSRSILHHALLFAFGLPSLLSLFFHASDWWCSSCLFLLCPWPFTFSHYQAPDMIQSQHWLSLALLSHCWVLLEESWGAGWFMWQICFPNMQL